MFEMFKVDAQALPRLRLSKLYMVQESTLRHRPQPVAVCTRGRVRGFEGVEGCIKGCDCCGCDCVCVGGCARLPNVKIP